MKDELTVGDLAQRSGVATSALRFYEDRGLITSRRNQGGQRRYERATLRRVAVIRAAQAVGLSLEEIRSALDALPSGRTPNTKDWDRLSRSSRSWRRKLDARIDELERLRDRLSGCIGCGCLSLSTCGLLNPGDAVAAEGPGARLLRVPTPED
jgi:MerR family redox-sensitive transcriptional activator SoxR